MIQLNEKEYRMKKRFISFLKDNNAFAQYKKRFINQHEKYDYTYNNFIKLAHGDYNFLINSPFNWFSTDDFDFWKHISDLVQDTIGNKRFQNYLKERTNNTNLNMRDRLFIE